MDGTLLVDKPEGWTSHDVVAKVRSILRQEQSKKIKAKSSGELPSLNFKLSASPSPKVKVGHTGTLDPMATGLLILVVGSYTRRAEQFSKLDKVYQAELTLGYNSSTGDKEGKLAKVSDNQPSKEAVEAVLGRFKGEIMQTPHKFSAVKINGQRAYKAARAGKTVEIEPRKVTIYQLLSTNYQYPKLQITAKVSSGTYIRSLAEDIGAALGTGAYLSALRRTSVDKFLIKNAIKIEDLSAEIIYQYLLPI